jgi:UDP-glucose 4-epimerase
MRVLVTGGAGFIGSHLVDRLVSEGYDVMVIDDLSTGHLRHLEDSVRAGLSTRNILNFSIVDSRMASILDAFRPDVVMLLAAQSRVNVSMRDPLFDLQLNLFGLVNTLEAARKAGVSRVVFASSGGTIYGTAGRENVPAKEDSAKSPESFYGISKWAGGEYLRLYQENFDLEYVALAIGNVYGPRQSSDGESGVIATFVDRLSRGEHCVINGDGLTTRDYVHVSDVVGAFMCSMTRGSGLINVGTGTATSVREVYRVLAARFDDALPPVYGPSLPGEARHIVLDPSLARRSLGWQPTLTLSDWASTLSPPRAETGATGPVAYPLGTAAPDGALSALG